MTLRFRHLAIVLFCLSFSLILSACGGGGSSPSAPKPIVGRWRQSWKGSPTMTVHCPGYVSFANGAPNACGPDDTVEFRTDGTLSGNVKGTAYTGTYTLKGDTLTLRVNGTTEVVTLDFDGNNIMIFRYSDSGIPFRDFHHRL